MSDTWAQRTRRLADVRFFRYLVVGGLNTCFGYGIFAGLLWWGVHYSIAAAVSTVLGVLFNFKTTGALVFSSRENSKIFKFVAVYIVIYLLNVGALALLGYAGVSAYLGGALLVLPLAVVSYFLNGRFVFSKNG